MPDAHADYEMSVMSVPDARGAQLRLVRHWTDGIMIFDPVKLVIYDAKDKVVAETPYQRKIVVRLTKEGKLKVYGVSQFLGMESLLPNRSWSLVDTTLVPSRSFPAYLDSVIQILRASWMGYAFSVILCIAGILSCLTEFRLYGTLTRAGTWPAQCALLWLLLDGAYGSLSVALILTMTLLTSLPFVESYIEAFFIASAIGVGILFGPMFYGSIWAYVQLVDRRKNQQGEDKPHSQHQRI